MPKKNFPGHIHLLEPASQGCPIVVRKLDNTGVLTAFLDSKWKGGDYTVRNFQMPKKSSSHSASHEWQGIYYFVYLQWAKKLLRVIKTPNPRNSTHHVRNNGNLFTFKDIKGHKCFINFPFPKEQKHVIINLKYSDWQGLSTTTFLLQYSLIIFTFYI